MIKKFLSYVKNEFCQRIPCYNRTFFLNNLELIYEKSTRFNNAVGFFVKMVNDIALRTARIIDFLTICRVGIAALVRTGSILHNVPPTNPYIVNMLIRQPLSRKLWRMKYKPLQASFRAKPLAEQRSSTLRSFASNGRESRLHNGIISH